MENQQNRRKPSKVKGMDLTNPSLGRYHDHLTQAYDRAFLFQFIPKRLKTAEEENYKIALFMIDLDNFKHINDTHGHLVGDKVIKGVVERLREALRENDYIIRYAGDEFLVILEDIELEGAYTVAQRLLSSVRKFSIDVKGKKVSQTTSMGFALFPEDANTLEELIERADEALYLVKKRSKDNFAHFKEVNINQISVKAGMNSFPCRTFINRENEYQLIKKRLDELSSKQTIKAVVACGESGIGKSRLLKETSGFCHQSGIETIFFSPYQKNSLTPYFLLSKTFNNYLMNSFLHNKEETLKTVKIVPEEKINILSHFLTCLKDNFPSKGDKPQESRIIFEAFLSLIKVLSGKKGGLFLGLDNIQYSDIASLEFFDYVLDKEPKLRLFIFMDILDPIPAGVYNPSAITKIIAKIGSRMNADVFKLGLFTPENAIAMNEAIFPGIGSATEFNKIIYEITKGHPFFIEELLKFLLEKSVIYFENDKWQVKEIKKEELPQSLDDVIRQRIEGLDLDIKETILLSSVIGEEINPEILSKIKSTNEGDILEILDKAKKLKIIKDEENGFSFLNIAAKEVTLNEIPEAQKKGIYNRVSEALMDTYKDNIETVSFQLANLFNRTEDVQQLNRFSKMITQKASSMFNAQEVLKYLEGLSQVEDEEDFFEAAKELEEGDLTGASEFLRLFQSAMKDFKLYPKGSKVRENVVDNIFESVTKLLEKYPVINVSEVEKSLVMNKRRITPRIARFVDVDSIVKFLIDRDVKSIIFLKDIEKEEISRFLEVIVRETEEIYAQGSWKDILAAQDLEHISVNKAVYLAPQQKKPTSAIKDKLEGAMLSDFILGKISGKDLGDINLSSILKDNPQALSSELLKASEVAKQLDQHSDKLDVIFEGFKKIDGLAKQDTEGKKDGESGADKKGPIPLSTGDKKEPPPAEQQDIDEKMTSVFKEFDSKTKANLIRKANTSDVSMTNIIKSLGEKDLSVLIEEIYNSDVSLWGFNKMLSKLITVYKYPQEKVKEILDKNVTDKLKTDDEKRFIKEGGLWKNLPLESRINDILRMDEEDLAEAPFAEISGVLEGLILKKNYDKLKEIYLYFLEKSLNYPQKVGKKVKIIYNNAFKNLSVKEQNAKAVFQALEVIVSVIKESPSQESLEFSLDLIISVTKEINLYQFNDHTLFDKMKIIYAIWRLIEESKPTIGEKSVESLKKRINFQKVAIDLFNTYLENPVIGQRISSAKGIFHEFLLFALDQIMDSLAEKLAKVNDPFERFVALNRLKGFYSALEGKDLEKFIDTIMGSFSLENICEALSYVDSKQLSGVLQNIYIGSDDETKENIIGVIDGLGLTDCIDFIKQISKDKNPPKLQKLISQTYSNLKSKK